MNTFRLITTHLVHVENLARSMHPRAPLRWEDLIGAGNLALVEAALRYDPDLAAGDDPFWGWACRRVRGAMIDLQRTWFHCDRDDVTKSPPQAVSLDEVLRFHGDGDDEARTRLDEVPAREPPEDTLTHIAFRDALHGLRDKRDKQALLWAVTGDTDGDIAAEWGVTPSRVCQVRRRAINRARIKRTHW